MQSLKGVIKAFTVAILLACFFQLTYTFLARSVESKADTYAEKFVNRTVPSNLSALEQVEFRDSVDGVFKIHRRDFLDSMLNIPLVDVWGLRDLFTYKSCRERTLSLGLDLKGGMSLILEIKEDDVLRSLAAYNKSASFNKAVEETVKAQSSDTRDFLSIFKDKFEQANPGGKLAAIFASNQDYQGKLTFSSTNEEVINVLRGDMEAAVDKTFQVLKTRIDQFGVASPNISLQKGTGRIILELPGVEDPQRVRNLLQQTAQLEFWNTYENEEIINYLDQVNIALRDLVAAEQQFTSNDTAKKDSALAAVSTIDTTSVGSKLFNDTSSTAIKDTAKAAQDAKDSAMAKVNPLWNVLYPSIYMDGNQQKLQEGAMVGSALGRDTVLVNKLLAKDVVKNILPRNLKLLWSAKPIGKSSNRFGLYAIQLNPQSTEAPLTGEVIKDARQSYDQNGMPEVELSMKDEGPSKWEKMTEAAVTATINGRNVHKSVAIVLDNRVFSCPRVIQKIAGGNTQITGLESIDEALDLANILKSGKLKAQTQVIEEQVVGPSLGAESIKAGLLSLIFGFLLVFLFMVAYYSSSGLIADLAMILNLFILVVSLIAFGAAFTLPAMAGILLTLAMAVDANVIINERVREEIVRGKGMRLAVDEGYQHSYSAIIDGNLTTMAIGIVLFLFGLGPIKGFGLVLITGLVTSMFTAVLVSRLFFNWAFDKGWNVSFGNKFTMNVLRGINFDFIGKRKFSYAFSTILFIICLSSMIFYGFDLGVDFKGGRSYVVQFDKDVVTEQVAKSLEAPLQGLPVVKTYGSNNTISITTAFMVDSAGPKTDSILSSKLYEGVKGFYTDVPTYEKFSAKNIKSSVKIEASIADDIRKSAFITVFLGLGLVFLYIFIRFRKFEYAVGAIVALIHDPVIVLGLFSLLRNVMPFSLEIDQNVLAAVLTLIGYSVNDTVVVFDRIREHLGLYPTRTLIQNVNESINSTLSRTIMTVVTVILATLILFLFGGVPVRGFSFALLIGLVVGTYSSIFVASPIMTDLMSRRKK